MRRESYAGFGYAFKDRRGWLRADPAGRSRPAGQAVLLPTERVPQVMAEADGRAIRA